MTNSAYNKSIVDLVNHAMRSPDRATLLGPALESLADDLLKPIEVGVVSPKKVTVELQNTVQVCGPNFVLCNVASSLLATLPIRTSTYIDRYVESLTRQTMPYVPGEIVEKIAGYLDNARDIGNLRLVNKHFARATTGTFFRSLLQDRVIYPRYESVGRFVALLVRFPALGPSVRYLTLVTDGMKMPEYGYMWAWEDLQNWENVDFTAEDLHLMGEISNDHVGDMALTNSFINGGGYRTMLGLIFERCSNIRFVFRRVLKCGEHLPGWVDNEKLQQLSFYHPQLNYRTLFYGDWNYDTVHFRVTQYEDEFGETVYEPNAGPQSSFDQDFAAAFTTFGDANTTLIRLK